MAREFEQNRAMLTALVNKHTTTLTKDGDINIAQELVDNTKILVDLIKHHNSILTEGYYANIAKVTPGDHNSFWNPTKWYINKTTINGWAYSFAVPDKRFEWPGVPECATKNLAILMDLAVTNIQTCVAKISPKEFYTIFFKVVKESDIQNDIPEDFMTPFYPASANSVEIAAAPDPEDDEEVEEAVTEIVDDVTASGLCDSDVPL